MGHSEDTSLRMLWLHHSTPSTKQSEKGWKYVNDGIVATNKFGKIRRIRKGCCGKLILEYEDMPKLLSRTGAEPITLEFTD